MSDHPKRTLPKAASLTHLKTETKALRAAFDAGDAAARERAAAHVSPLPVALAQAQALFVVAREYGFPSWPALKRHVERQTRTVFADGAGVARALAETLGDTNITIADSLEDALASDSEVLVLGLAERRQQLSPAKVEALRARKLVVTGTGADALCRELDLDIGGGMASDVQPIRLSGSALLGTDVGAAALIEPLTSPPVEGSFRLGTDRRHLEWRYVADELRLADGKGFIDAVAVLAQEHGCPAVVTRQANCVFAGVVAPPEDWSADFARLFRRVVDALAGRDVEDFKLAEVPRQTHPPGVVRFALDPLNARDANCSRLFYFLFDQPTVFTATLRHSGSDAAMLLFQGGRKQRLFTRVDDERGETLTIGVTITQASVDAMAGRYWTLNVTNFDGSHGMAAELTVRYDALDGGAIRPMPSDASFEHFHWIAERQGGGGAGARRKATAEAFGFDAWETLRDHVAWSEAKPPEDGARMRDIYFARAQAKHGESFGYDELTAFNTPLLAMRAELSRAVEEAFAVAEEHRHASVGAEHLLFMLLDDPAAADALAKCGADLDRLRSDLVASLESIPKGESPATSRELFGVLARSDLYPALGREGANAGGALVGMFAESCPAKALLEGQGLGRDDVIRYLAHAIPKSLPAATRTVGVLAVAVEDALHAAYSKAQTRRHEAFGVDHLLLGLAPLLAASARMRTELEAFVATTPIGAGQPRPTRALSRVMQQAVARSRQRGDAVVELETMLQALETERDTLAFDILQRYGVVSD